jgi:hypothetical protein
MLSDVHSDTHRITVDADKAYNMRGFCTLNVTPHVAQNLKRR